MRSLNEIKNELYESSLDYRPAKGNYKVPSEWVIYGEDKNFWLYYEKKFEDYNHLENIMFKAKDGSYAPYIALKPGVGNSKETRLDVLKNAIDKIKKGKNPGYGNRDLFDGHELVGSSIAKVDDDELEMQKKMVADILVFLEKLYKEKLKESKK